MSMPGADLCQGSSGNGPVTFSNGPEASREWARSTRSPARRADAGDQVQPVGGSAEQPDLDRVDPEAEVGPLAAQISGQSQRGEHEVLVGVGGTALGAADDAGQQRQMGPGVPEGVVAHHLVAEPGQQVDQPFWAE